MTAKGLEYDINLVDKAAAGFERTDSHFESTLSNCVASCREVFPERGSQLVGQSSLLSYFKKLPWPPQLQHTPP